MRWKCPHCGAALVIKTHPNENTNSAWCFSRCNDCGGHSLLNTAPRAQRTPTVTKISEPPTARGEVPRLQSFQEFPQQETMATQMIEVCRPVIRPATPRKRTPEMAVTGLSAQHYAPDTHNDTRSVVLDHFKPLAGPTFIGPDAPAGASVDTSEDSEFNFIPSPPQSKLRSIAEEITQDIDIDAYRDSQEQAGETTQDVDLDGYRNSREHGEEPPPFPEELLSEQFNEELPETAPRIRFIPIALGITAALGVAMILFVWIDDSLEDSSSPIPKTPVISHTAPIVQMPKAAVTTTITDMKSTSLVQYGPPEHEIAEVIASLVPHVAPKAAVIVAKDIPAAAGPTQTVPTVPTLVDDNLEPKAGAQQLLTTLSDQVHSQAMAPERAPEIEPHSITLKSLQPPADDPPLLVRPRGKILYVRSGPGPNFPVIGFVKEGQNYIVTDWSSHWYRVLPQINEAPEPGAPQKDLDGWIRTDTVQIVQNERSAAISY